MAQSPLNRPYSENWFSRLLDRKGADYIESGKLFDGEVLRNIDRIIDDVIQGRIDYSVYGKCIMKPVIFDNLLSYCRSKLSSEMTKQYCLAYTNWACENGLVVVANSNHMPTNGEFHVFGSVAPPYDFDAAQWNSGRSTITSVMRNDISTAYREVNIECEKYKVLTEILERVHVTNNVFELQLATNRLKQFIRSNNNIIY